MFHCNNALYLKITFQYTDMGDYIPHYHINMLQLRLSLVSLSYVIFSNEILV